MSKADWQETILSLGGPIAVGIITFGVMLAIFWLWDRWKTVFGGMYDNAEPVIPPRQPLIEIVLDPTRPAWHSAVSVQTVEFTKPATTAFTAGGDA